MPPFIVILGSRLDLGVVIDGKSLSIAIWESPGSSSASRTSCLLHSLSPLVQHAAIMKSVSSVIAAAVAILQVTSATPVAAPPAPNDQLTISTSSGRLHGKIEKSNPNVRQFLGIPFAQPPLGDLRFAPPKPLPKSTCNKDVEAKKIGPSCLQFLGKAPNVYNRQILEFGLQGKNGTGDISEDCLTLSVWAPTVDSKKGPEPENRKLLPVIIWTFGGGFTTGGVDVPYQIPTQWVQRTQDHLVISYNYRVNFFGFPNARGLKDQIPNPGLLDQRAVVEWARDNIAAFGGDPKRMVLWGQSAGSASVDYYNFAHYNDPIVKGFIMDSGTAQTSIGGTEAKYSNFTFIASQFGCGNLASDPAAELACVRKVDGKKIESFIRDRTNAGTVPSLSFTPVPDNKTVYSNVTDRTLNKKIANVPAIIGTNAQDGVPLSQPYSDSGPSFQTQLITGLSAFFCPATSTTSLRQRAGYTTYRYYYGGNFTNISPAPWLGAYHSSELPMLFGTYGNFRGPSTQLEKQTSEAFQDAYVAFAASSVETTGWKKYEHLGDNTIRNFGNVTGGAAKNIDVKWLERLCNGAKVVANVTQ